MIRGVAALVVILIAGCGETPPEPAGPPRYLGSESCGGCHEAIVERWRGSHHARALRPVDAGALLDGAQERRVERPGSVTTLRRDADALFVEEHYADGTRLAGPAAWRIGVEPLEQLLVAFPDGRLQPLRAARDAAGEWFDLLGDEAIAPDDPLHWAGPGQNANHQCLDCHVTAFEKRFDPGAGAFATRWAEPAVGCEACHGPGSAHVAAARRDPAAVPRWRVPSDRALDRCAACHSRRSLLAEGFRPGDAFLDHYQPALLEEGLYHADGAVQDEVYVWGSFLQSRMHRQGVVCGDCHDPHAAGTEPLGDAVCLRCHGPAPPERFPTLVAGRYDDPSHHGHVQDSPGARCVACHMPARTFMTLDVRHDHYFRVPRPDLARRLGVPDPCTDCHRDRDPAWAEAALRARGALPAEAALEPARVLADARSAAPGAVAGLLALAADRTEPELRRATALSLLAPYGEPAVDAALADALAEGDPLLRIGALRGLAGRAPELRWRLAAPFLDAPLRAVRHEAVLALADLLRAPLPPENRTGLRVAVDRWVAEMQVNADRADTHVNLAIVHARAGDAAAAERALRSALARDPRSVPALVNLADLLRATGRDREAGERLAQARSLAPEDPTVAHARALWFVRQGRLEEALPLLAEAAAAAPRNARYAFVHAVALDSAGRRDEAIAVLEDTLARFPADGDVRTALASLRTGAAP
ncbi:MAG: tetratricopeptide repeat protein [Pseudomonadales bacterium]|nr:tetratricopeptide repeat protein [Pseudomonadales bacterium]